MAPLFYTIFLGVVGCVVIAINVALWKKLGRWFQGDDGPATFALFASRLSIMLTFNAWLLCGLLMLEARAIFRLQDAGPIHVTASSEQGVVLVIAAFVIALATPFLVAAALVCGITGVVSGRRVGDVRAKKVGLIGIALNSLLIIIGCGMVGGFFSGGSDSPTDREATGESAEQAAD